MYRFNQVLYLHKCTIWRGKTRLLSTTAKWGFSKLLNGNQKFSASSTCKNIMRKQCRIYKWKTPLGGHGTQFLGIILLLFLPCLLSIPKTCKNFKHRDDTLDAFLSRVLRLKPLQKLLCSFSSFVGVIISTRSRHFSGDFPLVLVIFVVIFLSFSSFLWWFSSRSRHFCGDFLLVLVIFTGKVYFLKEFFKIEWREKNCAEHASASLTVPRRAQHSFFRAVYAL